MTTHTLYSSNPIPQRDESAVFIFIFSYLVTEDHQTQTSSGELGGGIPAHGREGGTKWSLRFLPTPAILWLHEHLGLHKSWNVSFCANISNIQFLSVFHRQLWNCFCTGKAVMGLFLISSLDIRSYCSLAAAGLSLERSFPCTHFLYFPAWHLCTEWLLNTTHLLSSLQFRVAAACFVFVCPVASTVSSPHCLRKLYGVDFL